MTNKEAIFHLNKLRDVNNTTLNEAIELATTTLTDSYKPKSLFGQYYKLPFGVKEEEYSFKIISDSPFRSNTFYDLPIMSGTQPTIHNTMQKVINVVMCGVVERDIITVPYHRNKIYQKP